MAACVQKGSSMTNNVLPPSLVDPLADKALALFSRLRNIHPEHEICERWAELFAPQKTCAEIDTIPKTITLFNKKKTDHELYELCRELEQILTPSLRFINK